MLEKMEFRPTPAYSLLFTGIKWEDDTMKPLFLNTNGYQPCHFDDTEEADTAEADIAAAAAVVDGTVVPGTLLAEVATGNKTAIALLQGLRRLNRTVHPQLCLPQCEQPPSPPSPTLESWNPEIHQVEEDQPLTDDSEDAWS